MTFHIISRLIDISFMPILTVPGQNKQYLKKVIEISDNASIHNTINKRKILQTVTLIHKSRFSVKAAKDTDTG